MEAPDKFDRYILERLQQDARTSAEQMAAVIGLSATAVQRRIRRLREQGVITAEVAVLDPARLGLGCTVLVEVQLQQGSRSEVIDGFKRRMAERPEVQQCFYVAGEHDFVLVVLAPDIAAYEALSRELFFSDPNIRKFRSVFVLDVAKRGLSVAVQP